MVKAFVCPRRGNLVANPLLRILQWEHATRFQQRCIISALWLNGRADIHQASLSRCPSCNRLIPDFSVLLTAYAVGVDFLDLPDVWAEVGKSRMVWGKRRRRVRETR